MNMYDKIASLFGLSEGDRVYLSSDITKLAFFFRKELNERFDPVKLLEAFQKAVGEEGTLALPVFSFDFSNNSFYDYRKTKGTTGTLGNTAMLKCGYVRTSHPMHSFAVWGADVEELAGMENIHSFGPDSPFEYFRRNNVKQIILRKNPRFKKNDRRDKQQRRDRRGRDKRAEKHAFYKAFFEKIHKKSPEYNLCQIIFGGRVIYYLFVGVLVLFLEKTGEHSLLFGSLSGCFLLCVNSGDTPSLHLHLVAVGACLNDDSVLILFDRDYATHDTADCCDLVADLNAVSESGLFLFLL